MNRYVICEFGVEYLYDMCHYLLFIVYYLLLLIVFNRGARRLRLRMRLTGGTEDSKVRYNMLNLS